MPVRRWGLRGAWVFVALLLVTACTRPVAPAPAVIRSSAPPWDAPRDTISYIEAAGLVAEPLNSTGATHIVDLDVVVDGWAVAIPANVGIDRLRAQRAVVHTHDTTNQVWLEGRAIDTVTLGQFFTVWGVRFDGRCLGSACEEVIVTADGEVVTDPRSLPLSQVNRLIVTARS